MVVGLGQSRRSDRSDGGGIRAEASKQQVRQSLVGTTEGSSHGCGNKSCWRQRKRVRWGHGGEHVQIGVEEVSEV
jgi:hypothetical protein